MQLFFITYKKRKKTKSARTELYSLMSLLLPSLTELDFACLSKARYVTLGLELPQRQGTQNSRVALLEFVKKGERSVNTVKACEDL